MRCRSAVVGDRRHGEALVAAHHDADAAEAGQIVELRHQGQPHGVDGSGRRRRVRCAARSPGPSCPAGGQDPCIAAISHSSSSGEPPRSSAVRSADRPDALPAGVHRRRVPPRRGHDAAAGLAVGEHRPAPGTRPLACSSGMTSSRDVGGGCLHRSRRPVDGGGSGVHRGHSSSSCWLSDRERDAARAQRACRDPGGGTDLRHRRSTSIVAARAVPPVAAVWSSVGCDTPGTARRFTDGTVL